MKPATQDQRQRSVTFADIEQAAARIAPYIGPTPLLENPALNERLGLRFLVKAEPLQQTGSFKLRGATNFIARLTAEARGRGVLAYSSGNHAQGVALAAKRSGILARIVMPTSAPAIKVERTRALGAHVDLYEHYYSNRDSYIEQVSRETGMLIVHPFDHPDIVAGQGTVGLEIAAASGALGLRIDSVFVPTSGGGLLTGVSTAIRERAPDAAIFGIEPEGHDDFARSIKLGRVVEGSDPGRPTFCDALKSPRPGNLPLSIALSQGLGFGTASDADIEPAMRVLAEDFRVIAEPGGAIGMAAILKRAKHLQGQVVVVVVSGGNVDHDVFCKAVQKH